MTLAGSFSFVVAKNDKVTLNKVGDGFMIFSENGMNGVGIAFQTPIEAWHFASKLKADLEKQMTPEALQEGV